MKISITIFFSCITMFVFAQQSIISLFPEGIPCENNLKEEVKEDARIGRIISKVDTPEIEVFLPPEEKANGTGVLICPGGGYTILAYDWEGTKMAKWLNERGVAAFVLKNRLPHWETKACRSQVALMDAQRAMRLIRQKANEFNVQSSKIGVMGFSAGGHLASTLSTRFDLGDSTASLNVERWSCRPDFSILVYPVITMNSEFTHRGSRENMIGKRPKSMDIYEFSNELQVSENTPPAILIHANDDDTVLPENSVQYYLALRKYKIKATLHIYQGGGHGFSFGEDKGATARWTEDVGAWMKENGW